MASWGPRKAKNKILKPAFFEIASTQHSLWPKIWPDFTTKTTITKCLLSKKASFNILILVFQGPHDAMEALHSSGCLGTFTLNLRTTPTLCGGLNLES